jgi:hypothetical protein
MAIISYVRNFRICIQLSVRAVNVCMDEAST